MRPSLLMSIMAVCTAIATAAPVGTAISYQGDLQKLGVPITDTCDFSFRLFDDPSASGSQVGTDQVVVGVAVTNGLFHVTELAFGEGAFNGEARWLDLSVKCTGDAGFVALSPRQAVTPTPYALRATEGIGDANALAVSAEGRVTIGTNEPPQPGLPSFHMTASSGFFSPHQACTENPASGKIYCIGAGPGGGIIEYDPVADQLVSKSAVLPIGLTAHSCVGSNATGTIFCFGGSQEPSPPPPDDPLFDQIIEYDPGTDTVTTKASTLPFPMMHLECVEHPAQTTILCFGGVRLPNSEFVLSDQVLEYDPVADTIAIRGGALPSGRYLLQCATEQSAAKILCFGGNSAGAIPGTVVQTDEIISYDPVTDSAVVEPTRLPMAGQVGPCVTDPENGKILCLGVPPSVYETFTYDGTMHTLQPSGAVAPCRQFGAQACAGSSSTGNVYCLGAWNDPCDTRVVEYVPSPFEPLLQVGDPGDGTGALANTWGVFSSRVFKTGIDPLTPKDYPAILARLRKTDVVRFRYCSDPHRRQHLGVIAEDAPREILTPDGQGVSLAEYSAFLLASVRALDATVNDDARELNVLVKSNELLNRKNTEHEARLEKIEAILNARLLNKDGAE